MGQRYIFNKITLDFSAEMWYNIYIKPSGKGVMAIWNLFSGW